MLCCIHKLEICSRQRRNGVNMYDVLIIGGGPAGMSAAVYARRAGMNCVVLEKTGVTGGQALYAEKVENYPGVSEVSGAELAQNFRKNAEELGATFEAKEASGLEWNEDDKAINVKMSDGSVIQASNVILAMGAEHRHLGVPGEDRLKGRGVSYCATCDGAFFRDKTVCVAGGGDSAAGEALYLSRICKKVLLIHRGSKLRAASVIQEKIKEADNIEPVLNTVIMEIEGKTRVEALRINNVISGKISEIETDAVFIAVGMKPQTDFLADNTDIEIDDNGYILADEGGRCGMNHVYAAGDVRKKSLRQIITAASDGANCIKSIEEDKNK